MTFRLSEYALAERVFLGQAIDILTYSRGGVLSMVRREKVGRVGTSRFTLESGETVDLEPVPAAAELTLGRDDIIAGNVDAVITMADEAAAQFHEVLERMLFQTMEKVTAATGNQIDATGMDINDAMYEMLEKLEITFEEDGSISPGFTIVASPEMAEKLAQAERDMTDEQRQRLNDLMDQKRREFFDRRRRRKLPRFPE